MRINSFLLIKFSCLRTVPAAETKSIGLQADARVVMVFARHLDNLIVTRQLTPTYWDLVPSRQITVTQNISSTYRVPIAIGRQKTRHRDPSLALWAGSDGT